MNSFCQHCELRRASVHLPESEAEDATMSHLCLFCAREKASDDAQYGLLLEELEAEAQELNIDFETGEEKDALLSFPIWFLNLQMASGAFDAPDEGDWGDADEEIEGESAPVAPAKSADWALRCACGTTWETIRDEGHVGCAACYQTFRESLNGVMARVQSGLEHTGKTPRAAAKRAQHGRNLQKRRQHALEMLRNRLESAVAGEKYEEAAKLRDKIREL